MTRISLTTHSKVSSSFNVLLVNRNLTMTDNAPFFNLIQEVVSELQVLLNDLMNKK